MPAPQSTHPSQSPGAAHHQGAARLQLVGGQRDDGGLRAAFYPGAVPALVGLAGGQHGVRRIVVSDSGSGGGHAAGAVRLHQCVLGHCGHRPDHCAGGAAHQRVRRPLRGGHGFAHPWRGLWLHRLHHHLADLRQLHLHFFCARSRRDGLCAGAGVRHAAGVGLSGVLGGGGAAGHARGVGHRQIAGVDTAAVAGHAGGALCGGVGACAWCIHRGVALWR